MLTKELKLKNTNPKTKRGLAESITRKYFIKQGYKVYRGTRFAGYPLIHDYPKNRENQKKIEAIGIYLFGKRFKSLQKILRKNSGIPDFFISSPKKYFFCEVKLEHESLRQNQKTCIRIIENWGLKVLLLRIKKRPNKLFYETRNGKKIIKERQLKLKLKWPKPKLKTKS